MVGSKRDIIRIAVIGGLIDGEEISHLVGRGGRSHHIGPDHRLDIQFDIQLFEAIEQNQRNTALLFKSRHMHHGQLDAAIGNFGFGQKLLGLVQIGGWHHQLGVMPENTVGQRANHQLGIACRIQHGLIVEGIGNRLAQIDVGQRTMLGVELDREGAEFGLDDGDNTGLVFECIHIFAGQIQSHMRFAALNGQTLV